MTLVRQAGLSDISYITILANKEGDAIGFIPKPAYEAAITGIKTGKRWSLTCNDKLWVAEENGDPVGFLLASFGEIVKVSQITIQEDARKLERGRLLLDSLEEYATSIGRVSYGCGCADDLQSNFFWTAMGWTLAGQRNGVHYETKKSSKRTVNMYRYYSQPTLPLFSQVSPLEKENNK